MKTVHYHRFFIHILVFLCWYQVPAQAIPLVNSVLNAAAEQRSLDSLSAKTVAGYKSAELRAAAHRSSAAIVSGVSAGLLLPVIALMVPSLSRASASEACALTGVALSFLVIAVSNMVAGITAAKKHRLRAKYAAILFKKIKDPVFMEALGFTTKSQKHLVRQLASLKKAHGASVGAQVGVVCGSLVLGILALILLGSSQSRAHHVVSGGMGVAAVGASLYALTNLKRDVVRRIERTQGIVDRWQEELDEVVLQQEEQVQEKRLWQKKAGAREVWGDRV